MLFGALNINQSRLARQSSRLDASRAFATSSLDLESRPRPILSPPRPDPLPHPSRARVVERTFGPDRTKSSSCFLSAFFVLAARSRSLRMCAAWRRSASSLNLCALISLDVSRASTRASRRPRRSIRRPPSCVARFTACAREFRPLARVGVWGTPRALSKENELARQTPPPRARAGAHRRSSTMA